MFHRVGFGRLIVGLTLLAVVGACSDYETRLQSRIGDLKAGKVRPVGSAGAANASDELLFASPIDVQDKNGQPTGIRLRLPKQFFNDQNQPTFQALVPSDASPAASKRTRGAATMFPTDAVLITYETPLGSIVFVQFPAGQAPDLSAFFTGNPGDSSGEPFQTAQGTWTMHTHLKEFDVAVGDAVQKVNGEYKLFKTTSKSRDVVVGYFASQAQSPLGLWQGMASASAATIELSEGL